MNNKGVPGLRKLCIFKFTKNDENVNLGVYPERDPENIAYPNLFTVKCPFNSTRHNKASEKYQEVKLWAGGARGAYLAHGLLLKLIDS